MKYRISYRDMSIYWAFMLKDKTKKEIADHYEISTQRVAQIIHKVGYLLAEYPDLKVEEKSPCGDCVCTIPNTGLCYRADD